MKKNSRLRSITLEGFQCIRDRTTIEFSPLTLFYGPNSAGKSAVADALTFIRQMSDPSAVGNARLQEELWATAKRWRHRQARKAGADDLQSMVLGITIEAPLVRLPAIEFYDHFDPEGPLATWMFNRVEPRELGVELNFRGRSCEAMDATYSVDGRWILQCTDKGNATVNLNLDHPLLAMPKGFKDEVLGAGAGVVSLSLLNSDDEEDGSWLYGSDGEAVRGSQLLESTDLRSEWRIARARAADYFTSNLPDSWVPPLTFLLELFNEVVLDTVFEALSIASIEGERLSPNGGELKGSSHKSAHVFQVTSVPTAVAALLSDHGSRTNRISPGQATTPSLSDWVDDCLTNHLFRESGYTVSPRVELALDVSQGALGEQFQGWVSHGWQAMGGVAPADDIIDYAHRYLEHSRGGRLHGVLNLELMLMDNHGRWLKLADVGSGIGYVLPCLVAWWYPLSFVSQPELHLHPALQADVGDVLIEVVRAGRQAIVESHSEHMLLRILRRIRERSVASTGHTTGSLIHPNEVVIYYFDPQSDGATEVKQVRVSSSGELLDRWPRGFFTERAQELL